MAGRLAATLVLSGLLLACGCRNREILETELRTREIQYRDLLDEHDRTEHHNPALEREVATLRQGSPISPEQASPQLLPGPGRTTNSPITPAGGWQPLPLQDATKLERPIPFEIDE
jgi:hypothetical protein